MAATTPSIVYQLFDEPVKAADSALDTAWFNLLIAAKGANFSMAAHAAVGWVRAAGSGSDLRSLQVELNRRDVPIHMFAVPKPEGPNHLSLPATRSNRLQFNTLFLCRPRDYAERFLTERKIADSYEANLARLPEAGILTDVANFYDTVNQPDRFRNAEHRMSVGIQTNRLRLRMRPVPMIEMLQADIATYKDGHDGKEPDMVEDPEKPHRFLYVDKETGFTASMVAVLYDPTTQKICGLELI